MNGVITFNKTGYDPLIDFIKAYAIICVLIGHTIPFHDYYGYGLWAGMQVPLFILIQTFHCLKKESPSFSLKKTFWRIIFPYLIIQSLIFFVLLNKERSQSIYEILQDFIKTGGKGPGSYYPWVYLQIAILLPHLKKWMDKCSKIQNAIFFLIICESLEVFASLIDIPDSLYRLLAIRYIFLFYLGWIWVKEGVRINRTVASISLISFLSIIYFEYFSTNDEILFYNTAWKYHRWPCYYFVAMGGVILLARLYGKLSIRPTIYNLMRLLAKCSYEIFLVQMLIIAIFPSSGIEELLKSGYLDHLEIKIIYLIIKIITVFVGSIVIGFYLNLNYNKVVGKFFSR